MTQHITLPDDVNTFLSAAGQMFLQPLCALSAAESLTDEVAIRLAIKSGLKEDVASHFVKALHFSDFVVERNSEWNLSTQARGHLNQCLIEQSNLCLAVHSLLYDISITADPSCGGDTIPRYLFTDVGKAYHTSPISPSDGLKLYSKAATSELTGNQWLLGKLAIEQQEQGILPRNAVEPPFLRGMTLYRERRISEAEVYLKRVILSNEIRTEVAIACHIVGKIESRKPGMQGKAEKLLRRSIVLLVRLHDQNGQAQVLHSLGQLIGKDRNRVPEAEELLRQSLALLETLHDQHGQAQVLHSLSQLIGKDRNRVPEAEELLRRSLALDVTQHGQAQVLHSLSQLIGKDRNRVSEAEELLRQSLALLETLHDQHGQAQTLHSLGQLIGKDRNRVHEAEELLRQSLEIGEKIHHEHHQAQALHSLGQLIGKDRNRVPEAEELLRRSLALDMTQYGQAQVLHTLGQLIGYDSSRIAEAEVLLRQSLKIGEKLNNKNHQAQVLFSLGKIIWETNRPEAEQMLRLSLDLNRALKNGWAVKMVQKELENRLQKGS